MAIKSKVRYGNKKPTESDLIKYQFGFDYENNDLYVKGFNDDIVLIGSGTESTNNIKKVLSDNFDETLSDKTNAIVQMVEQNSEVVKKANKLFTQASTKDNQITSKVELETITEGSKKLQVKRSILDVTKDGVTESTVKIALSKGNISYENGNITLEIDLSDVEKLRKELDDKINTLTEKHNNYETSNDKEIKNLKNKDNDLSASIETVKTNLEKTIKEEIDKLKLQLETIQNIGGKFIGKTFNTFAELNSAEVSPKWKNGDFTFVLKDENKENALTRYTWGIDTTTGNENVGWNFTMVVDTNPIIYTGANGIKITGSVIEIDDNYVFDGGTWD